MHLDDSKGSVAIPLHVVESQRFAEENGNVPGMVVGDRGSDSMVRLSEGIVAISSKSFRIKQRHERKPMSN